MERRGYGCGLEAALALVGGKWKALIIWQLHPASCRFGELRRIIAGISEKMLIQQLRELEADEVIHREVFAQVPPKVEYSLTEFGLSLRTALEPLCDWGGEHMEKISTVRSKLASSRPGSGQTPDPAPKLVI